MFRVLDLFVDFLLPPLLTKGCLVVQIAKNIARSALKSFEHTPGLRFSRKYTVTQALNLS